MSEFHTQTESHYNQDEWPPTPDATPLPGGYDPNTPDALPPNYVTAPDGYGFVPAETVSQPEGKEPFASKVGRIRNAANATIILGGGAAIATEQMMPGVISSGVEMAQQVYEQAPTPAAFALGSAAVAAAFSWQTVKNIRRVRQAKRSSR